MKSKAEQKGHRLGTIVGHILCLLAFAGALFEWYSYLFMPQTIAYWQGVVFSIIFLCVNLAIAHFDKDYYKVAYTITNGLFAIAVVYQILIWIGYSHPHLFN